MEKDSKKTGWGVALMVLSAVTFITGFSLFAVGSPEAAGTFVGAAQKASRPRRRVTRRYYGIFGPYTEVEYL